MVLAPFLKRMIVGSVMFFRGVLRLVSNRKHVLRILLSLELIIMSLIWRMVNLINMVEGESYFILYFLVFVVCEGALGVGLIVILIRSYGSDLFLSLNLTQC